jgi:hypothetical protein
MGEILKLWWRMQSYEPPRPVQPSERSGYQGLSLTSAAAIVAALLLVLFLIGRRRR